LEGFYRVNLVTMIRYFRCVWSVSIVKAGHSVQRSVHHETIRILLQPTKCLCSLWTFVIVVIILASKFFGSRRKQRMRKGQQNSAQGLLTTRDA